MYIYIYIYNKTSKIFHYIHVHLIFIEHIVNEARCSTMQKITAQNFHDR